MIIHIIVMVMKLSLLKHFYWAFLYFVSLCSTQFYFIFFCNDTAITLIFQAIV